MDHQIHLITIAALLFVLAGFCIWRLTRCLRGIRMADSAIEALEWDRLVWIYSGLALLAGVPAVLLILTAIQRGTE